MKKKLNEKNVKIEIETRMNHLVDLCYLQKNHSNVCKNDDKHPFFNLEYEIKQSKKIELHVVIVCIYRV